MTIFGKISIMLRMIKDMIEAESYRPQKYYDLSRHHDINIEMIRNQISNSTLHPGDLICYDERIYGILIKSPYIDRTVEISPQAVVDILTFSGCAYDRIPLHLVKKMQE